MEEFWNKTRCIALVVFNHKQVIINSVKHSLYIEPNAMDGSEDLVIYRLKLKQLCGSMNTCHVG